MGKRKRIPDHTNTQPPSGTFFFKIIFINLPLYMGSVWFSRKCHKSCWILSKFSVWSGRNLVNLMGFFLGGARGFTIYLHFLLNILASFYNQGHIVWWFFLFLLILWICLMGLFVCVFYFIFMRLFNLWSMFDWWGFCVFFFFSFLLFFGWLPCLLLCNWCKIRSCWLKHHVC